MHICIDLCMVKVISIRDDVYEELSKRKDNKSFPYVIRELLKESRKELTIANLLRSAAPLSEEEAGKIKKEVLAARKRSNFRDIKEV